MPSWPTGWPPQGCRRVAGRGARAAVRTGHTDGVPRLLETVRKAAGQHRGGRRWPVREELVTADCRWAHGLSRLARTFGRNGARAQWGRNFSEARPAPLAARVCAGGDQRAAGPGEGWPDPRREPTEHSRGCPAPARPHCCGLRFRLERRPAGSCPHDRGRCSRGGSPRLPGLHLGRAAPGRPLPSSGRPDSGPATAGQ